MLRSGQRGGQKEEKEEKNQKGRKGQTGNSGEEAILGSKNRAGANDCDIREFRLDSLLAFSLIETR